MPDIKWIDYAGKERSLYKENPELQKNPSYQYLPPDKNKSFQGNAWDELMKQYESKPTAMNTVMVDVLEKQNPNDREGTLQYMRDIKQQMIKQGFATDSKNPYPTPMELRVWEGMKALQESEPIEIK